MNKGGQTGFMVKAAAAGAVLVAFVLLVSTWLMGQSAQQATDDAVRSVSMFYLDELTGRREQVVESNLQTNVRNLQTAVSLLEDEDLSDAEHLQAFQSEMKKLYSLEKFAFVDENGLIYTSLGTQDNIDEYDFDYRTIQGPDISVKGVGTPEKEVIIAIPTEGIPFQGHNLVACFMEIDMKQMLDGLSLQSDANNTTFCNIYTKDGVALTDMVLGGLASEDNLLDALANAQYENNNSFEAVKDDFANGEPGVVSFTFNGIQETLDYVPVKGTDWMLTYLIRESVISDQVRGVMDSVTWRSMMQTILTALVLLVVFGIMFAQMRSSARLQLEKETSEAASQAKQEEMERRLVLQDKLLEQERNRAQQDQMITALASDYRGVYHVDLDADEAVCYQVDKELAETPAVGERFAYLEHFAVYADLFVDEQYREGFLNFIQPESIRAALKTQPIISYRYLVLRNNAETYEALRMAGVRHPEDRDDGIVHAVGVGFVDVDNETREQMAQSQALSDALVVAEEASKAKTAFLSNMSHEIRTPMNAIIGLDSIALADKDISDATRERLEKIGESAHHLLSLINDILDVSRIESGRMSLNVERFSFARLLEQVNTMVSSQCAEKGLDYHCKVVGQVDDCYLGDDVKLRQVLVNILGNAVKFTPEGGTVELSVERIAHYEGRSTLRFLVKDTGIGIDANYLPRIFDAFSQEDTSATSRYGSTGLGLAITKSVVELMNGTIDVESEKGAGTTFSVVVTLADSEGEEMPLSDTSIHPNELAVLVVDDDPVACEHARLVLEGVGITTETVQSGREAVEVVRLRQARHNPYNLILVDWKMPEMDGVETTRQIRSIVGLDSAIIILTAYNWDDVLEEALSAGVDCFIAKPLFAANVIEEFQQALERRGSSDRSRKCDIAGKRVLLVEDVPINAEIIVELLKMREMKVDHAENGRIAVDKFAASEPGHYSAVLMDMRMPEMDGLSATVAIRSMDRPDAQTVPVIALTANAFDEDVQKSLQAGLNAHLSKPIDPVVLFETLEDLIQD